LLAAAFDLHAAFRVVGAFATQRCQFLQGKRPMDTFENASGFIIARELVRVIQENKQALSDIDGATGDGDHGINMNKGFSIAGEKLGDATDMSSAFALLGNVLLDEIGGAMGPLYGSFFLTLARQSQAAKVIDKHLFAEMLGAATDKIRSLGGAAVGDKTMMDTLLPANAALQQAVAAGADFGVALQAMCAAAEQGRDSTRDLVARLGRASRLGERSRGVLDAGATSCCLILCTIAGSIARLPDFSKITL
jgi:dihydroxyacetone kinase-like protein